MKKILTLIMLTMICVSLCASYVSADAWFPPDSMCNENLMASPWNEECYALNVFISNYIETGIINFDENAADERVVYSMLKHFELNCSAYEGSVMSMPSEHGTFMRIKASEFENRTKVLYNRSIPATSVKGYNDGWIYAAAENYGAPITCLGSVDRCEYIGNRVYELNYTIYNSSRDVKDLYKMTQTELNDLSYLTKLGNGTCTFSYDGSPSVTHFKPSDFALISITNQASGIPYSQICFPCEPSGVRIDVNIANSITYDSTNNTETKEPENTGTTASQETSEPEESETIVPETTIDKIEETKTDNNNLLPIVIGSGVVCISAIAAFVIIVLIISKNKKA